MYVYICIYISCLTLQVCGQLDSFVLVPLTTHNTMQVIEVPKLTAHFI